MSEKRAGEQGTLSVAQRAIAHEYGFSSWPKLKAAVEARTTNLAEGVDAFLRASVGGPERRAAPLLEMHPEVAGYDFRTVVVLGDVPRVGEELAHDLGLAVRPTEPVGWPPLLGVRSSRAPTAIPTTSGGAQHRGTVPA
jgi:hypothetical protein